MKIFILYCCLAAALAMPEKRMILGNFETLFDLSSLKKDLKLMLDVLGSDPTEAACEHECHTIQEGHVLNYGCPFVCEAFQMLINTFSLVPDTRGPEQKRFALGIESFPISVDSTAVHNDLLTTEATCLELCLNSKGLFTACPSICTALQAIVQKFHSTLEDEPQTAEIKKRFLFGSIAELFHSDNFVQTLQLMLDVLGSYPTESACETECYKLPTQGLDFLHYGCPMLCKEFQLLVSSYSITLAPPGIH